ncbi:MAG TPA: thermonuclease family protein [Pirellulales bacterium]|nr:thermonuclease family protein [Pirellulales bacterium]
MQRRFRHPRRRRRGILLAAVVLLLLVRAWQQRGRVEPPEVLSEGEHRVERVIDGDTLLLADGARVRLIGVDCPETVKPDHPIEPWGPEARDFTQSFVAGGKVRLQFDRERLDRYDRFLAYVWVGDAMLNEELVRAGLARVEHRFHYSQSIKRQFDRAEEEARTARRGIWSSENFD